MRWNSDKRSRIRKPEGKPPTILQMPLSLESMLDDDLSLRLISTTPHYARSYLTAYHFGMFLEGRSQPVGDIELRLGNDLDLKLYSGHIGYAVDPEFRGQRLAARSLLLLLPLARRHGFRELWITCDPDNYASRRTCERSGAVLQEVVAIPTSHLLYRLGLRHKCRFLRKL